MTTNIWSNPNTRPDCEDLEYPAWLVLWNAHRHGAVQWSEMWSPSNTRYGEHLLSCMVKAYWSIAEMLHSSLSFWNTECEQDDEENWPAAWVQPCIEVSSRYSLHGLHIQISEEVPWFRLSTYQVTLGYTSTIVRFGRPVSIIHGNGSVIDAVLSFPYSMYGSTSQV